jgi:hypothetical protein
LEGFLYLTFAGGSMNGVSIKVQVAGTVAHKFEMRLGESLSPRERDLFDE